MIADHLTCGLHGRLLVVGLARRGKLISCFCAISSGRCRQRPNGRCLIVKFEVRIGLQRESDVRVSRRVCAIRGEMLARSRLVMNRCRQLWKSA